MARPRARSGADVQIHELVAYRLNALTNTILRSASRQYAAGVRMSPPEAWVLGAIGHFQPITAREVAERMSIDEAQVSRAIKSLLARGFVKRRPAADDNRRKILTLSPAGRRACERAMQLAGRRQEDLLDGFKASEVDRLVSMLIHLRGNAQRMLGDE